MKVGIIGDEPAGPVLAKAWAGAGHEVIGVHVESPEAIERVEALLPDIPIAPMAAVAEDAELLVLAVPNDDAELTCAGLADLGLFGPRKIVVHLSPHRGYGHWKLQCVPCVFLHQDMKLLINQQICKPSLHLNHDLLPDQVVLHPHCVSQTQQLQNRQFQIR